MLIHHQDFPIYQNKVLGLQSDNHKTFLSRLSMVRDRLYDCSTVGLYLQRIDDIMNYKAPKNKRVNFAMQWGDPESIFAERAA